MNEFYKIGMTTNLKKRMDSFSTLPFRIEKLYLIETENSRVLEKELHDKFDSKRVNGEWFSLNKDDISEINKIYPLKDGFGVVGTKIINKPSLIPKYKGPGIIVDFVIISMSFYVLIATSVKPWVKILTFAMIILTTIISRQILNNGYASLGKSKFRSYLCFIYYAIYVLTMGVFPVLAILNIISYEFAKILIWAVVYSSVAIIGKIIRIRNHLNYTFMEEYEINYPDE